MVRKIEYSRLVQVYFPWDFFSTNVTNVLAGFCSFTVYKVMPLWTIKKWQKGSLLLIFFSIFRKQILIIFKDCLLRTDRLSFILRWARRKKSSSAVFRKSFWALKNFQESKKNCFPKWKIVTCNFFAFGELM